MKTKKELEKPEKGCIPFYEKKIHPITGYVAITQRDTRWGVKQRKKNDEPIR